MGCPRELLALEPNWRSFMKGKEKGGLTVIIFFFGSAFPLLFVTIFEFCSSVFLPSKWCSEKLEVKWSFIFNLVFLHIYLSHDSCFPLNPSSHLIGIASLLDLILYLSPSPSIPLFTPFPSLSLSLYIYIFDEHSSFLMCSLFITLFWSLPL